MQQREQARAEPNEPRQRPRTVLLVLNYQKFTDSIALLQSIIDTELVNADIVILDNGSGNDSVLEISAWAECHFPAQGPDILDPATFALSDERFASSLNLEYAKGRLALFSSATNFGFSGGNNALAHIGQSLKYEFLYLLNSDILFTDPLSVRKLEALHDATPDAYMSGPAVINMDGTFDSPFRRDTFWGDAIYYGPINRFRKMCGLPILQFDLAALSKPLGADVFKISGAAMFFPSTRFEEIGGLDENVWLSSEEPILGEKILNAGGKVIYLPTTVVLHIKASAPRPKSRRVEVLSSHFQQRNYYYRTYRDFAGWQMALLRVGQALRLLMARL